MSSSSMTVGMLSGLTGSEAEAPVRAKSETTSTTSTTSTRSTTSALVAPVSAELKFASVNWDREQRRRNVDPRRAVDVPLTAQDKFHAVPWDPADQVIPTPVFTEDDVKSAEARAAELSVEHFFKKAHW